MTATPAPATIAQLQRELEEAKRFPDIGQDPLKLMGEERENYRSDEATLARLRKACATQQREVPDQTGLVWRSDLSWLTGQFAWREAGHKAALTQLAALQADKERLDWLETMAVNVRINLRHGSRDLFWATPSEDDGETGPSEIRKQVDAARTAPSEDDIDEDAPRIGGSLDHNL